MVAINAFFDCRLPLEERFRLIQRAGFGCVTLEWRKEEGEAAFRRQPELARALHLHIANAHAHYDQTDRLWEEGPEGERALAYFLRRIEDCAQHEIPVMVLHAYHGPWPARDDPARRKLRRPRVYPTEREPASAVGLARFLTMAERAETLGLTLALENIFLGEVTARTTWLLEQLPQIGLCYDSGHHHCRREGTADLLRRFGPRLAALHLHDNHGRPMYDEHLLPFDGTIDWPAQMRTIAQTGYRGPTALELHQEWGYPNTGPEELLALAYERAQWLEGLRTEVIE
ncbi:MAG: sugar phosphate isomerase/epimerase [Oscillospiraceae bacterium]|nr:sugar phosphate isomerase/epimerase [Oscillospiraceae bacterium]